MQKLARKTLLSIFAVAITIIAIGAITFAWFTMTTIAEVDEFDTDIRAESGIEISLDGQSFASYIRKEDIESKIKANLGIEDGPIILNPVTTANGFSNFHTITKYGDIPALEEAAPGKWIWFNLYFRTPEANSYVYLLDETEISSVGRPWKADITFNDAPGHLITAGETKMIYAANALRISFLTCNLDLAKIDLGEEPIGTTPKSVVVYELDPTYGSPPQPHEMNNKLGDSLKEGYGLIEYYRIKNDGAFDDPATGLNLTDYFGNDILPTNVLGSSNLVNAERLNDDRAVIEGNKAAILAFEEEDYHADTSYYYGAVKVQMWIEGWDPDSYNAIHMADLQISLSFGGTKQQPSVEAISIDAETEYEIEYIWEPGFGTPRNVNPVTVKAYELPLFLKPAGVTDYVFDGWYLTYEAPTPGEKGRFSDPITYISRDYNPGVDNKITVYGKLREYGITYELFHEFNEAEELEEVLKPKEYLASNLETLSISLPVLGMYTTGAGDTEISYRFLGWYLNPEYKGNPVTAINKLIYLVPGDLTLYAKWEAEYKIFYDFGVFEPEAVTNPNPVTVQTGELPLALQPATLGGYAFLGWYLTADFSGDPVTAIPKGITENVTLYARFDNFVIEYDKGIAAGIAELPVNAPLAYNGGHLPLAIPACANVIIGEGAETITYIFEGWYLEPDFSGEAITAITAALAGGNITLYAKWDVEIPIFYDFGGINPAFINNPNHATMLISEKPYELQAVTVAGYQFNGWYAYEDFSGPKITSIDYSFPVGIVTLYAKCEAIDYQLSYDYGAAAGSIELPAEPPALYNADMFPVALPELPDYIAGEGEDAIRYSFAGWYLNPAFDGEAITAIDDTLSFGDHTLYAKWEAVEEYTLTYDFGELEGVDNPNPATVSIHELPLALRPATLEGYVFVGWYLTADFSDEAVTTIPGGLVTDLTLYGKFTAGPEE